MALMDRIFDRARARKGKVVMPESADPRIIEAGQILTSTGIATVIPLARDPEPYVEVILNNRPKTRPELARRMLTKPTYLAGAMVGKGDADAMIAGVATPSRRVIEAASITIGLGAGVNTVSSFFLMIFPDGREMVFADCAVNVAPDAVALSDIAIASAHSATALLGAARVAMLSFSTGTSGTGASVDLVREAREIAAKSVPNIVGPMQADAALNPVIAVKKGLAGFCANTLIFPNLDAGNIAYKLAQELAGAQALGPFLQGFARPVCDLSRGASVDDIVKATAITLAMA